MNILSKRKIDTIAHRAMQGITILFCSFVLFIALGLLLKSLPILKDNSFLHLLSSRKWHPLNGEFGMLPFIVSTFWVTGLAILFSVPLCILFAIYLTEYANSKALKIVYPFIDILSGIPSVIFGVWGILVIVPFIRDYLAPFFGIQSAGYSILAGGLVLSIMVIPIIVNVIVEVIKSIPQELRDASLSLGATKWQTIKYTVLRKAKPGIIAAIVLGLSRAFGETLAVIMVVGNVVQIPSNSLQAGYPLPALIANNYGEMLSIPLYDSALMFSALILFIIVVIFNLLSRWILMRVERSNG
ncbi:MAG: phosphate ABC transporter permease subunit PstC [Bacteroidota bacterium]